MQNYVSRALFVSVALVTSFTIGAVDSSNALTQQGEHPQSKEFNVQAISEAFGYRIGSNLETPGFTFDVESIVKGMRDALAGKPSPMSEDEYDQTITKIQENAFNVLSNSNLNEANAFMEMNAATQGIVQVESGKLQYKVIAQGCGKEVFEHTAPTLNYTGTFLDGTVFGSSLESGEPIILPLNQTIQGISKGIVGMKEGEKRVLYIHPDLAYGTSGHLPPNSLLVFEVEVVKASPDLDTSNEEIISQEMSKPTVPAS